MKGAKATCNGRGFILQERGPWHLLSASVEQRRLGIAGIQKLRLCLAPNATLRNEITSQLPGYLPSSAHLLPGLGSDHHILKHVAALHQASRTKSDSQRWGTQLQLKEGFKCFCFPVTETLSLCPQESLVAKANAINKAIVSWQLWAFLEGETNLFMGLKSQLIYQARLAVFLRAVLPRGLWEACRWPFQPWLFIGTNLTNPRKRLRERGLEPPAPAHLW